MTALVSELVSSSAEEVLETMFFTQVVGKRQPEPDAAAREKPYLTVRMCFLGGAENAGASATAQPGGHVDVEVSRDGAQWIASSFLAADDGSVPQHKVADVICELTNVVCGRIMSQIASVSGFTMLSPEVIRSSSQEWPHAVGYEESFQLERGWLTVRLGLTEPS